jgi:asparagine synthase (glutamine-hydrolysing)
MCGIWALIKSNPQLTQQIVESFNKIKKRGPDSSTLHIDRNYIAGFHRLAINDLSVNGNQPFFLSNLEYNYILMANGEIYNHHELETKYDIKTNSTSDCAVLLPLFIKLNENFNKFNNELRGEYSIVIFKQHKKSNLIEFFVSTDALSIRPMFYYIDTINNEMGFSSLLGGLSSLSNNVKRLDQGTMIVGKTNVKSFNEYTVSGYHKKPDTLLEISDQMQLYDLYEKTVNTLTEAIVLRLESDRPIGCLLSGGLDSSLIAAIAAKELAKRGQVLRTFSIGMEDGTDIKYAQMVADHIGSDHTVFYFTQEEGLAAIEEVIEATETYDITTIRASVGQYLIAKNIAEKTDIKVILNGDGADECQMGYLYFYLHPNLEEARLERDKLVEQIHLFDGLRVDRNISYHGLEARVPFLDKEFVDLFYQIPTELLVPTKQQMEKHFIRKAFEVICPDLLPSEVLWRKKEAFSDGVSSKDKSWYLIVKDFYNQLVSDDEFETRNELKHIIPHCKESFYYRKRFNELYGQNHMVIPRYWLANWTDSKDPSARTLKIYSNTEKTDVKINC